MCYLLGRFDFLINAKGHFKPYYLHYVIRQLSSLRPNLLEGILDSVENREGQGHLEADSVKPGQTSFIEAPDALGPGQMLDTLNAGSVFSTLHSSLDHVNGGVTEYTGATLIMNRIV